MEHTTLISLICWVFLMLWRGLPRHLTLQCNLLNIVQHDTSSALKCISYGMSGSCPSEGLECGQYLAQEYAVVASVNTRVCSCQPWFTSARLKYSFLVQHIVSVWHNAFLGGLSSWLGHVRDKWQVLLEKLFDLFSIRNVCFIEMSNKIKPVDFFQSLLRGFLCT